MTLTEFLLARIAEDEKVARKASHQKVAGPLIRWNAESALFANAMLDAVERRHAARHDPARVLAECEAKRRIVELARTNVRHEAFAHGDKPRDEAQLDYWCEDDEILRYLATVYADHPDYREEWKP